ncbi:uncharacterized protein Nmag_3359 [Natrialba magadii ATCC 43099]|uniref:Uncharacterized protein n=1 Tax=Natrialba magadii (strain ATCC 43099 / DSM 3394 / CCM 3739 / CIP 104546 / IAM 13178 / JCM 8861 / NBRC 102185 / NCIMB 2190 / MS3) TaxID=547559 RepID=D3SSR4_NATMM|nr:hypothetical protein [Natrialba magadii]ADD06909.1 uncharacterized protein Nmag_3359 [Natrialba magadii ATCC 43099]ELY28466.1 hypothetical protein C500_13427 [Natrialba magadii ATCC 43099]
MTSQPDRDDSGREDGDLNHKSEPESDPESEPDSKSQSDPTLERRTTSTLGGDGIPASVEQELESIRTTPRRRAVALVLAGGLGVVFAWFHWIGLVLGGALVGLVSTTFWRALVTAAGFGLVVLGLFVISLGGATAQVLEMAPVVYLIVGAAIGLPVFGSLVRGIV